MRLATALGLVLCSLAAFPSTMQSPQIGFVLLSPGDPAQDTTAGVPLQVRAILGSPGAALLSEAVALPQDLTQLWLAPRQAYALAAQGDAISLVSFQTALAPALNPLSQALVHPELVAFSPSGTSVALYSSAENRLQVLSGLPAAVHVCGDYSLKLAADVQMLATSDDASAVLIGAADGTIYSLAPSGTADLVYSVSNLAGMIFLPGTNNAALVDAGQGAVIELQGVNASPTSLVLADHLSGLQDRVSIASGSAGSSQAVVIANPGTKQAIVVGLASRDVEYVATPVAATTLQPLEQPNQFVLSAVAGKSAWILDYNPSGSRVYFAAAPRSAVQPAP